MGKCKQVQSKKYLLAYSTSTVSAVTSDVMGTSVSTVSTHKMPLAHLVQSCKGRSKNLHHLRSKEGSE